MLLAVSLRSSSTLLLSVLVLAACIGQGLDDRRARAATLAAARNWQLLRLDVSPLPLIAYVPTSITAAETLTVYMEGDGLAWLTRSHPSDDPTPRRPLALELALQHAPGVAAYLGRPCQYLDADETEDCAPAYWTSHRFSPEVVEASNRAISALKEGFGATQLVLVGYSGGGAIAALVAARRQDVVQLVTVAGNLDHHLWTRHHGVLRLDGSLNPALEWERLRNVPQLHFVGADDANIPAWIATHYASAFPASERPEIRIVPGFNHVCCWAERWPELYEGATR
ncbi:MAG: alpha/beta fold hydrolase [Candidatus Accumulibacter delftensis]|jgi:dienelactone hydrolase